MNGLVHLLNLAIGMALVFLVVSVLASQLNEIVARVMSWRAKDLRAALMDLLDDPHFDSLAARVLGHPLVPRAKAGEAPSYITPRSFGLAVLDIVNRSAGHAAVPLNDGVRALVDRFGSDPDKLQAAFEQWFSDAMDRVTGAYKRRAQLVNFILAAIIAVVLNINSIKLAGVLYNDPRTAGSVADFAETVINPNAQADKGEDAVCVKATGADNSMTDVCFDGKKLQEGLFKLGLPIGWDGVDVSGIRWSSHDSVAKRLALPIAAIDEEPMVIIGWVITALAASLGAQFWFDTLGKLLKMRSAGPTPDEKKKEQDKTARQAGG